MTSDKLFTLHIISKFQNYEISKVWYVFTGELPDGAQCDFDTSHFDDQMFDTLTQYSEVCGWKIPHHSAKSMSDILANGAVDKHSSLKIDLEIKPNEKIILSSPVFPPPPKYNNDKASPFFESCKVMSIHLTFYFLFHKDIKQSIT